MRLMNLWQEGSAVKSVYCSCRGPGSVPEHPCKGAQNRGHPLNSAFTFMCAHRHTHILFFNRKTPITMKVFDHKLVQYRDADAFCRKTEKQGIQTEKPQQE